MAQILCRIVSWLCATVLLVAGVGAADPRDELLLVLKEWEEASAAVLQPQPDTAFAACRGQHNAHELEAASELLGPVVARRLVEEYHWTLDRHDSGEIRLHGEPRDVTTSLFFSGVDVVMDGSKHRPVSIQFFGGYGERRARLIVMTTGSADKAPAADHTSDIQLVSNVAEVPDEPAPPRPLDLETILERWQESVSRIATAEIGFDRYVYDLLLRAVTRSKGRLLFEAPNLGVYELEPVDANTDPRPAQTDAHGGHFTLQPASRERWQWDGTRFWVINLDYKYYDVVQIRETPPETKRFDWNFLSDLKSPALVVPGVVDVSDDFLNRFQWNLGSDDDRGLMLQGAPKSNRDCREIRMLQVLIDRDSFRTKATRVVSATGQRETTHVFQYVSVNDDRISRQTWVPDVSGLTNSSSHRNSDGGDGD